MSEINNSASTSVCNPIRENKQLNLDEKICCGNDNDCINVSTQCYTPHRLILCHEISGINACERRNRGNLGAENDDAAKEVCKKENLDKHLCISTDSLVNNPSLNGELNWIINRTYGPSKTELGASCQACICCNGIGTKCERISGNDVGCIGGCPINNITMLNQKCTGIFKEPIENITVGNCSDMFESGTCQFYNISTGNLVEVKENSKLYFQSEVCDLNVKLPPNSTNSTNSTDGDNNFSTGDKIGTVIGAAALIVTVFSAWIAWKQYKSYKEKRKNSRSEIESNNQKLQAQSLSNVENSESENGTEVIPNDSHIQPLADQRNEEIEIQQNPIPS